MSYIALKTIRVGGGLRRPGDAVPEAADWPNVHEYLRTGVLAVSGETPGTHEHLAADLPAEPPEHDHDADYSATAHDHNADYSALAHDHDADYAADDHAHPAAPVGYAPHGATAGFARPEHDLVIWVGSVEPTNAVDDDLWIDTSA